jgi:hypothetical protein
VPSSGDCATAGDEITALKTKQPLNNIDFMKMPNDNDEPRGELRQEKRRVRFTASAPLFCWANSTRAERGLAVIQSPRKPNGLSHGLFECLIVEASSQAQNHLSVVADRYTEGCRGVFDCTGDG